MEARSGDAPTRVQLDELLHVIVEDVQYECRSSGIEGVNVDLLVESTPSIDGFPAALSSAIENVLRNAVRHSPPNQAVTVTLRQDSTNAVIEIVDQGSGVAEAELDSLFEPFFRSAVSSNDKRPSGSGLGLAIARRAMQKNGGSITANNAADGGLLVTIEMPL